MTGDARLEQWRRDAAAPFEGWDFSYLKDRMVEAEPVWDYLALARAAICQSTDLLDVATGGGEILSSLAPFPGRARAVEGFEPNLPIARARLEPLGVQVFRGGARAGMPFDDGSFDLILNRHGGFRAAEMVRVLQPGGVFLTQQVAGDNLADLAEAFGAPLAYPGNTLDRVVDDLRVLGCEVRRAETWRGAVTFSDVGALAYFLKAIPWVVQDFDVDRHRQVLEALQAGAEAGEPLSFTYTRYLVEAVKA
ncbi:MAG: class I SAM-dependent methyltransferase [Phenylobacterium sp.]|uniref:class I SAM-dependent methyltransferase n=1 Tax=Phenylobacterium sp. TaxID=1871053 RepID=UPI002735792A|nr:class I SAM-dependent methyltransferase [Phenylobacterium sp.]MDP3745420.1 class I SAM-dependent methyltransferase [Phenylobacterium sp.]